MHLTPREQDKLLIYSLGSLAQRRLARGLVLNRSEAVALIAFQLHEFIRDGRHSVAELMDLGKKMLGRRHVMGELILDSWDHETEYQRVWQKLSMISRSKAPFP